LEKKKKRLGTINMNKIIILHGWTKNLDKWNYFLEILKKKGFDVELLKIPGLTEKLDKVWDLPDYVQWLKNIVDKEKDKIILMGHSNGGRIALSFTNSYPEKVKKLILIDSAGIYHNELTHRIKLIVFRTIAKIGKKMTSSKTFEDLLYRLAREGDYRKSDPVLKQTMINLLNSNKNLNISKISTPTLIIWGEKDKITPLSDGIVMNELIKNSKFKIVSKAKHSPMYTHAQEVAKIIYENI
jgi:pimeloyl-ACP methyl ester carboxylesterase